MIPFILFRADLYLFPLSAQSHSSPLIVDQLCRELIRTSKSSYWGNYKYDLSCLITFDLFTNTRDRRTLDVSPSRSLLFSRISHGRHPHLLSFFFVYVVRSVCTCHTGLTYICVSRCILLLSLWCFCFWRITTKNIVWGSGRAWSIDFTFLLWHSRGRESYNVLRSSHTIKWEGKKVKAHT